MLLCQKCGFNFYVNPKPCNAVILENEKGEILLVKRKYPPRKNYWDLPGGFVDIGETLEQSVGREVKEETGLNVKNLKYLGSYLDRYLYQGDNYYTIGFSFVAKTKTDKIKLGDDVNDFQFILPKKVNFKRIAFKGVARAIRDYMKLDKFSN